MFESFGRGFRMISASIKMGWQDKRLLLPSILTVFTNLFFGILMLLQGKQLVAHADEVANNDGLLTAHHYQLLNNPEGINGLLRHASHGDVNNLVNLTGLNGQFDPSGLSSLGGMFLNNGTLWFLGLMVLWWLTNRFLEGVTTALVYSNLTEGPGTGKFSEACSAVFSSLPAIFMLGVVTLIVKRLAFWLRNRRNTGFMGFGFNFLSGIVEIFWTLAGHLILPAIVIEGTSFWGGLKRADRIGSGNLLTIGIGEVGVDAICRIFSLLVYSVGIAGIGYVWYAKLSLASPQVIFSILAWILSVVLVTAISVYIRAAFFTCLYAWAIDAEAVHESQRMRIPAPGPLAAALS